MPDPRLQGIEIEGAGGTGDPRSPSVNPFGVDFQYEWEAQPNRYHNQWLNLPEFYLDITPVTQGAFAEYLVMNPLALSKDRYHYLKNVRCPPPLARPPSLDAVWLARAVGICLLRSTHLCRSPMSSGSRLTGRSPGRLLWFI